MWGDHIQCPLKIVVTSMCESSVLACCLGFDQAGLSRCLSTSRQDKRFYERRVSIIATL
jgi:hypothetical protein